MACSSTGVHRASSLILHPAMCLSRREDSLNHNRVKNNLGVSRNCKFGHRMEPSRLSSEASQDSSSTAKSNASIIPFTTQRFVVNYRILCFELENEGSFRWSTWSVSVWFNLSNLTYPSHVPRIRNLCVCVCVCIYSGAKKYLVSHQLCKFSHLKR